MEKEDFIKGRIYYIHSAYHWVIQFKKFDGDSLQTIGSFHKGDDKWWGAGTWGNFRQIKEVREATYEEKERYFRIAAGRGEGDMEKELNYQIY